MRATLVAAATAAAAVVAIAGCGGEPGELMTITTHGGGGPTQRLVVLGDGRATCNGGRPKTLPSEHVLDAREVERELEQPAHDRRSYSDGPPGARSYTVSTKDGIVTWVEGARGAPPVVAKGIVVTQELKRDVCPGGA